MICFFVTGGNGSVATLPPSAMESGISSSRIAGMLAVYPDYEIM